MNRASEDDRHLGEVLAFHRLHHPVDHQDAFRLGPPANHTIFSKEIAITREEGGSTEVY